MALPIALIAAVATQVLCQLFKVFYYSAKDGVFSFSYFFSSGGMPSAHSAFVTALATAVALNAGIFSDVFAACAVFGFIVMYDAFRLRGTVEKLTIIIRKLLEERSGGSAAAQRGATFRASTDAGSDSSAGGEFELPKMLGHTVPEIAVGIVVGLILGGGIALLLRHIAG